MAFEDDLGYDPTQPIAQDYTLSASELVTRTFSLWSRKIVQYIIIVGVISAVCVGVSFVLLSTLFGTIGTLGADPISYLLGLIFFPESNLPLLALSFGFAIFAFVLNAIIFGAAIKFTLDEYGGNGGDVGTSFSHSFGRVLTIIIVQLILGSIVAIILTPATTLTFQAMDMIDISDPFSPIIPPGTLELLMYALALFLVGGIILIYLQVRFAPTLAIVVDTDLSAIDSLKKSWELTSGNFFHVFGGYILLMLVVIVLGVILSMVVALTLLPYSYLLVVESVISALLFGAFNYIFAVVLYRDLVSRKGISDFPEYVL